MFCWSGDIVSSKRNQVCHETCDCKSCLVSENCEDTYAGSESSGTTNSTKTFIWQQVYIIVCDAGKGTMRSDYSCCSNWQLQMSFTGHSSGETIVKCAQCRALHGYFCSFHWLNDSTFCGNFGSSCCLLSLLWVCRHFNRTPCIVCRNYHILTNLYSTQDI